MDNGNGTYHVFLIIIATCIILANAYALSLFMRHRSLLSKTNYLLLSLALSEFMTGTVNIPLMVHAEASNSGHPRESMTFVITADITTILCASITMISLCGIIVDRYLVICFPMKYYSMVTKRRIILFIVISWVLPLIVSFIRLVWLGPIFNLPFTPSKKGTSASALRSNAMKGDKYYYIFGSSMYLFIITVLFILFVLMFRAIKRLGRDERDFTTSERNNAATLKRETKAVILFAVMYFAFIFCWTPLVVFRLLASAFPNYYNKIPLPALHALILMKYLTSVINPLLYILYKLEFYQEFKNDLKMLQRLFGCGKRRLRRRRTQTREQTEVSFFTTSSNESQKSKLIHGNGFHEMMNTNSADV